MPTPTIRNIILGDREKISTVMVFNTTLAGSASTHVILPLPIDSAYDMVVKWGDGTSDHITAYDDAAKDHTYPIEGIYTVEIIGKCWGWRYNNGGDKMKLLEIKRWGKHFRLGADNANFHGCGNLIITAPDLLDTSESTTFAYLFRDCVKLATVPKINLWNTSKVTRLTGCFQNAAVFNDDIGNWDVSKVTGMTSAFWIAKKFNKPLANWNTANVVTMDSMFKNLGSVFQQNLGSWDVSKVEDMTNMFEGSTLSTANYDALLIGWAAQALTASVPFHGGGSIYTKAASDAATAHADLTDVHLWTITDGGPSA